MFVPASGPSLSVNLDKRVARQEGSRVAGSPCRLRGHGTLTQPVARVPLEEGSQQTLGLHAEELRHAQLGSAKQSWSLGWEG